MKTYLSNLRPSERRLVAAVGVVFFIVINWLFVFPHFSDWSAADHRMWEANRKLKLYEGKIALTPNLERQIRALESEGLAVPAEEQSHNFASAVTSQAAQSGVTPQSNSRIIVSTNNPFFLELSQNINVQGREPQIVDFLYHLGSGNSLIRVRDLNIGPDPSHQQLVAGVKLVASYQKKTPTKGTSSPASRTTSNTRSEPGSELALAGGSSKP
jgi:hypothetical protein